MRKIISLLFTTLILAALASNGSAFTEPREAHPRLISDAEITRLQAARVANTTEWQFVRNWCAAPHSITVGGGSRVGTGAWYPTLYAIAYAACPDSTRWARLAYTEMAKWLDRDISGTGYDTVTVVTNYDVGYNMRFMIPATALVYDLCYDYNEANYPSRNTRLENVLDAWLHYWYINRRNADPSGTMCYRPYSNHYIGQMYGLLYGGYAIYTEKPTYSTRYLSYGRDTMLAQFAAEAKDSTKIWTQLLSDQGQSSGGLLPDGFPGYVANGLEFLGRIIETVGAVEDKTAEEVMGINFITGCLMTYMYATYPSTRFNGSWRLWGSEEGLRYATISRSAWYSMLSLFGAAPASNDTTRVAKWWLENYKTGVDPTASDWGRYAEYFWCSDHTVTSLSPATTTGHSVVGDTWTANGASTLFYRNNWSGISSDDIHLVLRGGNASDGHVQNDFGTVQITAGDMLVGNYKLLANTSDEEGQSRVSASSDWANSGMFVKQDAFYTSCQGGYCGKIRWSSSHERHNNNRSDWLYHSVDLTPFYNNVQINGTYPPYSDMKSHVTHKDVEWLYLKQDSVLLMMDRLYTREANYFGGPSGTGCDTLWSQQEACKQWQIWTYQEPAAYEGVGWRVNGRDNRADLIVNTAYPTSGVSSTAISRKKFKSAASPTAAWRVVDSLETPNEKFVSLHTMKIVANGGIFNVYTPTNTRGSCAVAAFKSNRVDTLDYLIAFGVDDTLNATYEAAFDGDSIIIGHDGAPRENTRVMVANLIASTPYYWASTGGSNLSVTISKSDPGTYTTAMSDTSGMLVFDTGYTVYAPNCSVYPTTLGFGTIETDSCSAAQTFSIANLGTTTLSGTVSESHIDFEITEGDGAYNLAPGESLSVSVRFCPTSDGAKSCTVETGDAICSDVSCTGTGETTPSCTVTPSILNFGSVNVGSCSSTQTITVANTGGTTLAGTVAETSDDFEITEGDGAWSLAAGETLLVVARFCPQASGVKSSAISLGNETCLDSVSIGGTGLAVSPTCTIDLPSVNFGNRVIESCTPTTTITITNSGEVQFSGNVSLSGCDDFVIISGSGAYTLEPLETHAIGVRFCPQTTGIKSCTIETGESSCSDIYLSGVGINPMLDVLVPHSGTVWTEGTARTIVWDAVDTTNPVKIELRKGTLGITLVGTIANSASNTGYYTWTVEDFNAGAASDYRIYIIDTVYGLTVSSLSDAFTIQLPSPSTKTNCHCGKG